MRQREQKLWDRVRNNLRRWPILLERMENVVGYGTPDVHAVAAGNAVWFELKSTPDLPARPETPLLAGGERLSVDQVNWHLRYAQYGGRSYVAIGVGSYVVIVIPGKFAASINSMHLGAAAAAASAVNWEEFAQVLMGQRS